MIRHAFRAFALLVPLTGLAGQRPSGDAPADSLAPRYKLGEIVVTATRSDVLPFLAPSAVNVISRSLLDLYGGGLLSSALEGTPGTNFHAYGGGLSVQTVSLRGMPSEHSLVLVDGQRYNSVQSGLADFSLLTSSDVDHVEIVRGGYSSLYGADAIGGVINIITEKPPESFTGTVLGSIGSRNYSANELTLGGRIGETGLRGMFRRERGRGDYPFRFFDGATTTELNRTGGDFSMVKGEVVARFGEEDFSTVATATFTEADRGSPGPVTDPSSVGRARLYDKLSEIRGRVLYRESDAVEIRMNFTGRLSFERYTDPGILLNGAITNSEYTNRDFLVGPEIHFAGSPVFTWTAGMEWGRATLASSDTRDAFREQRSAFLSTQHQFELPWGIPFEVILYPSLRFDSYSDVDNGFSPKFGVNIGLLREPANVRLRTSVGRSYHVPVFNDLYWKAGGNPALKPEHAVTFDAGFVAEFPFAGTLHLDAGYFDIRANDHVTWIPGPGGFWSPRNIREVTSRGVEAEGSWMSADSIFTLTVNSTWTDARKKNADFPGDPSAGKRLIYVPAQTAYLAGELRMGWSTLVIRNYWSSYRFTTEINDHFLPSYSTTSAALRIGLPLPPARASLTIEVNNIFNTSYEIVALYPMPLREVRGTLEVTL